MARWYSFGNSCEIGCITIKSTRTQIPLSLHLRQLFEALSMNKIREIKQLYHSANNFFNLAKNGFEKLTTSEKNLKVDDISKAFETDLYKGKEKQISIILSYLSSSAIRISTIYESLFLKPENKELYKEPLDINNIHFFLRDNVAHKEPDIEAKAYMEKRQKFINELSIEKIYFAVMNSFNVCRSDLLQSEKDIKNLGKFIKKYKEKR